MKYTHKVDALRIFKNNCSRVKRITFTSDCPTYSDALISLVNHNREELGDCFLIEPVTKSPITFDLTLKMQGGVNSFNSDRFFMTFNELDKLDLENMENFISIVKQPFCRVTFSKAGKLGEFLRMHADATIKDSFGGIYCDKSFDEYDRNVFSAIANGVYYEGE